MPKTVPSPQKRPPKKTPGSGVISYSPAEVAEIFERLRQVVPEPTTALSYTTPFTLLVAVVLSAQSTDAMVNKVTPALFAEADTPERICALGRERLEFHLRRIGLYRTKARHILALSQILIEKFGSQLPATREDLESLPGVGRKTANVVLNVAFNQPTIPVDTHLFRIGNRLGLAPGSTPRAVEEAFEALIPTRYKHHAHHWLIFLGRNFCKARKPLCSLCPIADLCKSQENTTHKPQNPNAVHNPALA